MKLYAIVFSGDYDYVVAVCRTEAEAIALCKEQNEKGKKAYSEWYYIEYDWKKDEDILWLDP